MEKSQGKQKEVSSSVSLLPKIEFELNSEVKEKRLHILHVDDDASFLEVSKEILSLESNFEVDAAESVEEAYRKMSSTSYDAIVSDYQMPDKNGLDFLKELRAQKIEIPYILLTGKGREEIAIEALNLGADGYVNKGNAETVYGELTHYIRQAVEKKQAKIALSSSQEQLEAIIMNAPIGISASYSTDKIFEKANAAFCKILGYTKDELRKLTFREITYPEDLPESISKVEDLKAGKIPAFTLEKRYIRKDGSMIYGKVNVNTVRDRDGKICLFIVELEDTTERKRAEQNLKESEEKYKTLFEQAEQADNYLLVLEVPATGFPTIFDANASALQAHGYRREEIIGKPITFLDEDSGLILSRMNKLLDGEKLNFTAKHRRKDGSVFDAEVSLKKVKIGSKIFLVSLEHDITERKKMEDAIRQDREMLEALTENLGVGFGIISKDYRVLWVNRFIKNNVGDVEGKQCYSSLNTLDHICPDCGVRKVFEEGVERDSHEYTQIGVNGKPYYVELIATPLKDKDGNVTAALEFVVDIAEKKQREKDLRESREEFKALFNCNPQATVYADENFSVININPKFTEVFGYTPAEICGKNQFDILVPEELRREMNNIKKSFSHEVSYQAKRKDGSTLPVFISLAPVLVGGKRIGSLSVYADMTDQVAAEDKIEAALKQSEILNEKLSVVGSFTRHDVRNKLMAIEGNAYLAKKQVGNDPKVSQCLDQIRLATTNITRILEFAKNYESLGSEQRTQMDIGGAIDQAASLFGGLKNAELINECRGFNILADSMLTTMFHNLIDNSLKYGKNLTKIRIYHGKEKDGSESIVYEDNGGGISEENKTHLFTKGFGQGTGLGLYLIKRTCDIYGWTVKETGDFGKGSKFEFNIPSKQ